MDDKKKAAVIQDAREALAARKENRRKQNPTKIAHKMYRMNFEGNIIPHSWYIHIKRENGKPYTIAIVLLSEIVYWYRPEEIKDETTGQVIGLRKRYAADKLQRTYDSFADQFGFTKRQVKDALKHLEGMTIIDLDLRDIPVGDNVAGNVLFIGLDPGRLAEITYRPPSDEKTIEPLPSDESASEVYQFNDRGLTKNGQTNTETTPKTTPEITEEDISISARKTDSAFPENGQTDSAATAQEGGDADAHRLPIRPTGQPYSETGGRVGGKGKADPLLMDLDRATVAKREAAGGAWTAPPSAGGDDGAAHAGIVALAEAKGSSPPKRDSGGYAQQSEKFNEALKDQGEQDPEVASLAAQMLVEEKPAMANPYYRSFRGDYGDYLGRARGVLAKQRAKPPPPPEPEGDYEPEYFPELVPEGPDQTPWNLTLDVLRAQVGDVAFFAYYRGTRLVSLDDGVAVVHARSEGARDFLQARAGYIGRELSGIVGRQVEMRFEVKE